MCGNYDSVIGMEKSLVIDRFFKKSHLTVAEGELQFAVFALKLMIILENR